MLQGASFDSVTNRGILAKQMNIGQRRFIRSMISGFTAGNFEPVEFVKTKTFRRQVRKSLQKLNIPVDKLVQMNHITIDEANLLMSNHILTLGDIFKDNLGQSNNPDIRKLRRKILDKAGIKSPSQG